MIRLYAIIALALTLVGGGLGSCAYIEHQKVETTQLKNENATLQGNVKTLEKKIEADAKVKAADDARAKADAEVLATFKEKSRATIKGLKDPGHVALDRDATERLRSIFSQH